MMALNHVDPAKERSAGGIAPDIKTLSMRELSLVARLNFAIGAETSCRRTYSKLHLKRDLRKTG